MKHHPTLFFLDRLAFGSKNISSSSTFFLHFAPSPSPPFFDVWRLHKTFVLEMVSLHLSFHRISIPLTPTNPSNVPSKNLKNNAVYYSVARDYIEEVKYFILIKNTNLCITYRAANRVVFLIFSWSTFFTGWLFGSCFISFF